jgi:hypothetical protein
MPIKRSTLLWTLLVVFVAVSGPTWLALSRFEPGGGSSYQPPPVIEPDGSVRIGLKLTVWGGGGPINGRNTDVVMYYKSIGSNQFHAVSGHIISSNESMELYEFRISHELHDVIGPIDCYFEATLDGYKTKMPGQHTVAVP